MNKTERPISNNQKNIIGCNRFVSNKNLEYLRINYSWDVRCETSIPVAMRCFL